MIDRSIYVSIYLSICLSIYLSICPSGRTGDYGEKYSYFPFPNRSMHACPVAVAIGTYGLSFHKHMLYSVVAT